MYDLQGVELALTSIAKTLHPHIQIIDNGSRFILSPAGLFSKMDSVPLFHVGVEYQEIQDSRWLDRFRNKEGEFKYKQLFDSCQVLHSRMSAFYHSKSWVSTVDDAVWTPFLSLRYSFKYWHYRLLSAVGVADNILLNKYHGHGILVFYANERMPKMIVDPVRSPHGPDIWLDYRTITGSSVVNYGLNWAGVDDMVDDTATLICSVCERQPSGKVKYSSVNIDDVFDRFEAGVADFIFS
jgi:hypothetical protein